MLSLFQMSCFVDAETGDSMPLWCFLADPKWRVKGCKKKAALNSAYSENGEAANSRMWTLKLDFPVISEESWLGSLGSESPIRSFSFLLEVA